MRPRGRVPVANPSRHHSVAPGNDKRFDCHFNGHFKGIADPVRTRARFAMRRSHSVYRQQRGKNLSESPNGIAALVTDARGLNCPLPLLKLKKLIATRPGARCYALLATDPDSEADIRSLAAREGFAFGIAKEPDGALRFELTRQDARA